MEGRMSFPGLFITGTGTDIGKTVVTSLLLRELRRLGINTIPMKPVQTGCTEIEGTLNCPDLDLCLITSGMRISSEEYQLMSPFRYQPACSPHLAGELENRYPDFDTIQTCWKELKSRYDFILAEGAGGVLVPLDKTRLTVDLIRSLDVPTLVVSSLELGTINHTLMTIRTLKSCRIPIEGILFTQSQNPVQENAYITRNNPEIITALADVPLLGILPYRDQVLTHNPETFIPMEAPLLHNYILQLAEKIHRENNQRSKNDDNESIFAKN